jgi:hypothetical protein
VQCIGPLAACGWTRIFKEGVIGARIRQGGTDQRGKSVGLAGGGRETRVGEKGHGLGEPGLAGNPAGAHWREGGRGEKELRRGAPWLGNDPGWEDCGGRRQAERRNEQCRASHGPALIQAGGIAEGGGRGRGGTSSDKAAELAVTGRVIAGCDGASRSWL